MVWLDNNPYLVYSKTLATLPGTLQVHDGVLALVRAGGHHIHPDLGQPAGVGITMATARLPQHLYTVASDVRRQRLQACRQGVELESKK